MAYKTVKGHRVYKDGTLETAGERETRHIVTGGVQAAGGLLLLAGGLASMFNIAADNPALYLPLTEYIKDASIARITANWTQALGGLAMIGTACRLSWLAYQNKVEEREARTTIACFKRDYRPGDNRRIDAELARKAADAAQAAALTEAAPR